MRSLCIWFTCDFFPNRNYVNESSEVTLSLTLLVTHIYYLCMPNFWVPFISFLWAGTSPQHSQALCSIRKWMIPKFMICTETSKTFLIIVGLFVDTMALTYVMRPRESFYIIMVLVVSLRSFGCVYSMTGFSLPWQYNVAFCLATCWYDGSKGYTAYVIFPLTSCLDFILLTFK